MLDIILIQLYWFSFAVIGFAVIALGLYRLPSTRNAWFKQLTQLQPLILLLVAIAIGLSIFTPLIVIGYFFELHIHSVVYFHIVTLCTSVFVLAKVLAHRPYHRIAQAFRNPATLTLVLVVGAVLAFDYGNSVYVGTPFAGGDDTVHVSRVNAMVGGRMALADPFLGHNGVVDPRYFTNLLHALQASVATTFNVSAWDVWKYSNGFYRLLIWIGLFSCVWFALSRSPHQRLWSYSVLFFLPLTLSTFFTYALYPDRIVLAWIALFITGLVVWFYARNPLIVLFAAVLIAMTHMLYALMALGFTVMLVVFLLLFRQLKKPDALLLSSLVLLLMPPVLLNLHYPNRIAQSEEAFNASVISGNKVTYEKYGGFLLHEIKLPLPVDTILALISLCLVAALIYYVKNRYLKLLLGCVGLVLLVLTYSPLLASLIAVAYLLYIAKDVRVRGVVALLAAYYVLIVYNPIFIGLFHDKIPPWVIGRFQEFNILALILPILGLFVVFMVLAQKLGILMQKKAAYVLGVVAIAGMPYIFNLGGNNVGQFAVAQPVEDARAVQAQELELFSDELRHKTVFSQRIQVPDQTQQFLPMVAQVHIVSMPSYHYPPMVDPTKRESCQKALENKLSIVDLHAAKVDYILHYTAPPSNMRFKELLESKPYVSYVRSSKNYNLYKVNYSGDESPSNSACNIPYGQ